MRIEIGTPVTGNDLAGILRENSGTFLAQQGGQCFLVVAASGHSIKFGPKPIGRRFMDISSSEAQPGNWTVTKLSENDLSDELGYSNQQQQQRRTTT